MKKGTGAKIVCLLLCLLMVSAMAISCSGKKKDPIKDDSSTKTSVVTDDPNSDYDEKGYLKDSLGDKNYGGKEVQILSWKNNPYLFPDEEGENDPVMQLVYSRDRTVEEKLNVNFSITKKTSSASSNRTEAMELYNVVATGADPFDVVASYSLYPPLMAYNGLLYDLNTLEYPETDKPWYPKNLHQWEVYDRLFYITGNSAVRTFNSMHVIYANTDLLAKRGITDVIQNVVDGAWTLEKLQTAARNWQSEATDNPDPTYGLLWTHRTSMDAFYYGSGFHSTVIDDQGLPQLDYIDATRVQQIDDFIATIRRMMDSAECHILQSSSSELMEAHKTVFYAGSLGSVKKIAGDKDIAVIPFPKLNEEQDDYVTIQDNAYDVWGVPASALDPQLGAVIIEAMMSSDYRTIGPDYFDRNLKYRYANSAEGVEIFEIIRTSLSTDFGRINQKAMDGKSAEALVRDCVYPWTNKGADGPVYNGQGFSSMLASVIEAHKNALKNIHTVYRNYKG